MNISEAPEGDPEKPLQVLISTIDYNEYVGRIGIGKVDNGEIAVNKECIVVNAHDPERKEKVRITKLYEFEGLDKVDVKNAQVGSIASDLRNPQICQLEIRSVMWMEQKQFHSRRSQSQRSLCSLW